MKANVTTKSGGDVGPTGYIAHIARPTRSTSAAKTIGNRNTTATHAKNAGGGLTIWRERYSWGGISRCPAILIMENTFKSKCYWLNLQNCFSFSRTLFFKYVVKPYKTRALILVQIRLFDYFAKIAIEYTRIFKYKFLSIWLYLHFHNENCWPLSVWFA